MNVYIYEGTSRDSATKSLVSSNRMPTVGATYSVSASSGIMIIAYPNEDVETDLQFEYWVTAPVKEEVKDDSSSN